MFKKSAKGNISIVVGIVILAVIIIISVSIFAISKNHNQSNSSYNIEYEYNGSATKKAKLKRKDIATVMVDEKEYDLTKTLRELGIGVDKLTEIKSEQIVEYEKLKAKADETYYIMYNDYSKAISISDEEICETVTLKAGQTVKCWFYEGNGSFGTGTIVNNSNSDKNILDCNIESWKNLYVVKNAGSLNGLKIGETTRDEVLSKYKKYAIEDNYSTALYIECEDGSKVSFSFHDEDSTVANPETIKYISIELKY